MQHRFLCLAVVLYATGSSAQEDLLACVDPDVRLGLLSSMSGVGTLVTRTVPDQLAGLPQSENLEFIGSSVSDSQILAAYKSALATDEAMDTASAMLSEAGWSEFSIGGPPSGGFVTGVRPEFDMFCRDDAMLNVMGSAFEETTYVRLSVTLTFGGVPCGELEGPGGRIIAQAATGASLFEYLPTLVLSDEIAPLNSVMGPIASIGGFSRTGQSAGTEIELETALSAQDLIDHFGQQLEEQGWTRDTGWTGANSSGSSWTHAPAAELELAGLLDVVALGDSAYRASFRVSSLDSE